MSVVRTVETQIVCAVCRRRLLMGERTIRFSPGADEWVDVCQLCSTIAREHGWIREGAPSTPLVAERRRRIRVSGLVGALERRAYAPPSEAGQVAVRPLTDAEQSLAEAAAVFNESAFRRTVLAIAKSLGPPRASLVVLSGVNLEVVITVAWEISWYQYRVTCGSAQPVRLAERGYELGELEARFTEWNGRLDEEMRITVEG